MKRWSERFFSSTRGRVVHLLRRGEATVSDLSDALDVTDNAIRSHLAKLERDGLVHPSGKRPGKRKPETLYALTDEAEQLFPKAYHHLLNRLLDVIGDRLSQEEIKHVLREVGRRLAVGYQSAFRSDDPLQERAEAALEVLGDLGGLAEMQEDESQIVIRGQSCPLATAVQEHPAVCELAEALLEELIGAPVQETCVRNGTPQCVFQVEKAGP